MAPKSSSASSATRKKHASRKGKAVNNLIPVSSEPVRGGEGKEGTPSTQAQPHQKDKKKDKKAPKVKRFVPPPTFVGEADPVDIYKLGTRESPVSPERAVMLRKIGKKDPTTIERGLEEWLGWINSATEPMPCESEPCNSYPAGLKELSAAAPVLLHHFPRLSVHPSRRVRALTLGVLASLLNSSEDCRTVFLCPASLEKSSFVGTWIISTKDPDKMVRSIATKAWSYVIGNNVEEASAEAQPKLQDFSEKILEHLLSLIESQEKGIVRGDDSEDQCPGCPGSEPLPRKLAALNESAQSTSLRLQALAFEALTYLLKIHPCPEELFSSILNSPLYHRQTWVRLVPSRSQDAAVRKSMWGYLQLITTVEKYRPLRDALLPVLKTLALHAAFSETNSGVHETMIVGLVSLLNWDPTLWLQTDQNLDESGAKGSQTDSPSFAGSQVTSSATPLIEEFYSYLETACSGNPILLYPALILLLNSFPITPERAIRFFSHFWQAYGLRSLRSLGVPGISAFYHAWSDCVVLFCQRLQNEASHILLSEFDKMWLELLQSSGEKEDVPIAISSALSNVVHRCSEIAGATWAAVMETVQEEVDPSKLIRSLRFFDSAYSSCHGKSLGRKAVEACGVLLARTMSVLFGSLNSQEEGGWIRLLRDLLSKNFQGLDIFDDACRQALLRFCRQILPLKIWQGSRPHHDLLALILVSSPQDLSVPAWLAVMDTSLCKLHENNLDVVTDLLNLRANLDRNFELPNPDISQFALSCLSDVIDGKLSYHSALDVLVVHPSCFVQGKTTVQMFRHSADALNKCMVELLYDLKSLNPANLRSILLICLAQTRNRKSDEVLSDFETAAQLARIASGAFVLERFLEVVAGTSFSDLASQAKVLYTQVTHHFSPTEWSAHYFSVLELLRDCVQEANCHVHPLDLTTALRQLLGPQDEITPWDFLCMLPIGTCTETNLNDLLPEREFPLLLEVVDPLMRGVPSSAQVPSAEFGFMYDRIVLVVLDILIKDRTLAQTQLWAWEHCMYLGQVARIVSLTGKNLPSGENLLSSHELEAISAAVDTHTTDLISSHARKVKSSWHSETISLLGSMSESRYPGPDPLKTLILRLAAATADSATEALATVAVRRVLSCLFEYSDSTSSDLASWLSLCRQLESSNKRLCLAVINSLSPHLHSNDRFQQYQSGLAARLTDMQLSTASEEGSFLVELLSCTAPPPDSAHIFLPHQRVLFLLQALGKWLDADEDIAAVTNGRLLELFLHLMPIVQSVIGTHWDMVLDLVAVSLEEVEWDDEVAVLSCWHSCRLLRSIQNLLHSNQPLQLQLASRVETCVKSVLDSFVSAPVQGRTGPFTRHVFQVSEQILRDPSAQPLYAQAPLDLLLKLVFSSTMTTSCLAFDMARSVIRRLTAEWTIEVELEPEKATNHSLPSAFLKSLHQCSAARSTSAFLGWLLAFSYFENASLRLKNAYNSQLRDSDLVSGSLLPLLYDTLNVSDRGKPVNVSIWDIASFDLSYLANSGPHPISLAAYVYYMALRVVPSHIRAWWEGCRNRQLSMTAASFTSRHFSSILIREELNRLKEPSVLAGLLDSSTTVKVNTGVKEVKVTYTLDGESMEIVIRMPADYPLQPVEVLDIRKVGVPEATWRAWLLVVQQIIANQNGTVAEALVILKKNILLHFDGVDACAICYAIISVVDRSLPNKACRTCRNRFHPSCLYKWFSTSHSSSCPLCRSLF